MSAPSTPCVGKTSVMFDPRDRYAAAKALCASCRTEMVDACLFRALAFERDAPTRDPRWGVFGGVTPTDRRRIARVLGSTEITRRFEAAEAALRETLAATVASS